MQKGGILNSHIAKVLADLGHTDSICIGDCGLPIPDHVQRIDLALEFGKPSFAEVVELLNKHMRVEKIVYATEMESQNPEAHKHLVELFEKEGCHISHVCHEDFKKKMHNCKCIIRTGENTPYCNVILEAHCIFA